MIRKVLVLGGGSAGLLAALSLKVRQPMLDVHVVHSPELGIIGVGEGSLPDLPRHLHGYLGIDPADFHRRAHPTFKLGIRFLWGPREAFYYPFTNAAANRAANLPRPAAWYAWDDCSVMDQMTALMAAGKGFPQQGAGIPLLRSELAYHVENVDFVAALDHYARAVGIHFTEARVAAVEPGPAGIASLQLSTGEKLSADLYVDCSGFRSELLGRALGEPFISYADSLFCDRAVAGGWQREGELVLPYTTAETMPCGWCWQIEHEHHVNRGYVYASAFVSDGEAERDFRVANPKVKQTRVVKFRVGRHARTWVGNVVALGNAAGFVEPLEATALFVICNSARMLVDVLDDTCSHPTPTALAAYNKVVSGMWDEIRDFLAVHYRFNTRLDTPFWRHCREHVALHGAEPIVQSYLENGPTSAYELALLPRESSIFQLDGFHSLLLGQKVRHAHTRAVSDFDRATWMGFVNACRTQAANGLDMRAGLQVIRDPRWKWTPGFYQV